MVRSCSVVRWLCAICIAIAGPAAAQQFSADLLIATDDGTPAPSVGKISVAGPKVRIQTPNLPDGFFLVDTEAVAAYFVRPAQRLFMDAKQTSRLTQWLVPVDPEDPCAQWQLMAGLAGAAQDRGEWRCTRLDTATIDDRPALHYRVIAENGAASEGWIDPSRHFPVKFVEADGTRIALRNVTDGPQADRLFQIPIGFRRFDPHELIERIKQSDVWVERPH